MKKSLIALAALGAFASSAMAQSSVTLYGIVDLGIVKQSRADSLTERSLGGVGMSNKELNVAQATKSRIGFRGVEDLGGGLSAKFALEHRFTPDTGAINTSGGNQFWDQSIVGLTSQSFGEITLGRDYGPTFYSQYLLDPWLNQGVAEVGGTTYAFAGYNLGGAEARYNDGIFYKMAANGFTVMLSSSLSEEEDVDNRYGAAVNYSAGPLFVTVAYDQAPSNVDADETNSLVIIGASYDFGMIKPRISFAQSKLQTPFGGEAKPTSFTLAATAPLGNGLLKMGYTQIDWDTGNPYLQAGAAAQAQAFVAANQLAQAGAAVAAGTAAANGEEMKQQKFSLGYEYTLSKRTAVYADITSGKTKGSDTVNAVDFGIRHAF
ncbi:MAG TPA: porin [Aquabacterium sp.]|nr:porin [Aquabacterium sp.]